MLLLFIGPLKSSYMYILAMVSEKGAGCICKVSNQVSLQSLRKLIWTETFRYQSIVCMSNDQTVSGFRGGGGVDRKNMNLEMAYYVMALQNASRKCIKPLFAIACLREMQYNLKTC